MAPKRIGIVGYGHLGQYLTTAVAARADLQLAFVWNRNQECLTILDDSVVCRDLADFHRYSPDLVVEVAHPDITRQYGAAFLSHCDYLMGSPTALADVSVEEALLEQASSHGLYLPAGALWGGEDIRRMADLDKLKSLTVTMKKHPRSLKLLSPLREVNAEVTAVTTLYEGPVRELCRLAPNNVNTMAAAAVAAHTLGFDGVQGCLVADPGLEDRHVVVVEAVGRGGLSVTTTRDNPAPLGVVTGTATYESFLSSVVAAGGKGSGVHLS